MYTPGLYAAIFVKSPNPKTAQFNIDVEPLSVYLAESESGTRFKPFNEISQCAVVVSIPGYLELLKFFRDVWPEMESAMNLRIADMRSLSMPLKIEPGLGFLGHGMCKFEKKIGDSGRLRIKKDSTDPTDRFKIKLECGGKAINLQPVIVSRMARNLSTLLRIFENILKVDKVDLKL